MNWIGHLRALARSPGLVVWCLFALLTPLYVFKSGLPQPGDILVILLLPFALLHWDGKLDRKTNRLFRALVNFTLWVCVVNVAWAMILGTFSRVLLIPVFYMFNAAVFFAAVVLARPDPERFLRITVDVVTVTILYQTVASFVVFRSETVRAKLFFNNPNQLGYYALLSACLLALVHRRLGMSKLKNGIALTACAYLALLSTSRSALAGIVMLLAVMLFSNPKVIVSICILSAVALLIGGPISDTLQKAEIRVSEDRSPERTFAEERGYDRIWNHPEHLLLGAGEGNPARFTPAGEKPHELHSSFGTVLFGYGIVGLGLFFVFAARLLRGSPLRESLTLAPVCIYTVAHNGLRFTSLWILLVAFVVMKRLPVPVEASAAGTHGSGIRTR